MDNWNKKVETEEYLIFTGLSIRNEYIKNTVKTIDEYNALEKKFKRKTVIFHKNTVHVISDTLSVDEIKEKVKKICNENLNDFVETMGSGVEYSAYVLEKHKLSPSEKQEAELNVNDHIDVIVDSKKSNKTVEFLKRCLKKSIGGK